ncbi:radical SAM protein [Cetobacterium sp.]|uniref:radical SAM protein n=1 Tax=Cetobacterium sp. TaxID=2071632 RepID=UPI003F2B7C07
MLKKEDLFGLRNYATVKLTTDCNLKCSYCYQNQKEKNNNLEFINEDSFKKILEKCENEFFKNESFHLTLIGGEITVFEINLLNCLELLKHKSKIISTLTIVTNGTLISENFISSINDLKKFLNIRIIISRDIIKEEHDKHRIKKNGEKTYDLITENILKLKKNNIEYTISSVFNFDYNFENYINLIDEDTNIIGEYSLNFNKEKIEYNKILCQSLKKYFISILNEEISDYKDIGFNGLHLKHLKDVLFRKEFGITMCDIGNLYSFLPNGDILSCHQFCSMEESNTKLVGVGNIYDSKKIKNYFKTYSDLKKSEMACYKCDLIGCCQGSCSRVSGDFKCIPWRKIQALEIFNCWKEIISIEDFLNKYNNYLKKNFNDSIVEDNKMIFDKKIKELFLK